MVWYTCLNLVALCQKTLLKNKYSLQSKMYSYWEEMWTSVPALSLQVPSSSFCSHWNFLAHSKIKHSIVMWHWNKWWKTPGRDWITSASICSSVFINCSAAVLTLWSSLPSASTWRSFARKPCVVSSGLSETCTNKKTLGTDKFNKKHKTLLTFLSPVNSPPTFSNFFAVCSTDFSISLSFFSSASSSGLFCLIGDSHKWVTSTITMLSNT